MSAGSYITASSLAELHDAMSAEEWAVMHDVDTMRLASALDLQTLHGLRAELHVRSFRRLLQGLHERQVLFRLERTVGGRRAGSSGFVYGIGIAGQRLLHSSTGEPVRRPWTPRPSWLRHALATSHLYVVLKTAEAERRLVVERFESEPACWRQFAFPGGGTSELKPDAFAQLGVGDFIDSFFVETDLATESPATIARKLDQYTAYWQSGREQEASGVFPFVLWLVTDKRRAAVIQSVIDRQTNSPHVHRVATQDQALAAFLEEPP